MRNYAVTDASAGGISASAPLLHRRRPEFRQHLMRRLAFAISGVMSAPPKAHRQQARSQSCPQTFDKDERLATPIRIIAANQKSDLIKCETDSDAERAR
jgi:hypothetical protein